MSTERILRLGERLRGSPIVQQILKSGLGTAFRLGAVGMGMLFAIFAARFLGAEEFGIYVSLLAVATLVATGLTLGLPQLLAREIAMSRGRTRRDSEEQDTTVVLTHDPRALGNVIITLIATLATLIVLSWTFLDSKLATVATFIGLTVGGTFLNSTIFGLERVLRGAASTDLIKPATALLCLFVLGAVTIAQAQDVFTVQILGLMAAISALIIMIGLQPFRLGIRIWSGTKARLSSYATILKTGLLLAGSQILITATTQVDILVLTALDTPENVSYYFAAARAALVVSFFFGINAAFAEPTLTRLIAENRHDHVETLAIRTARSGLGATIVAVIAAGVLGPFYLSWYGEGFEQAYPALLIMLIGMTAWALFGPSQNLARAARLDRELLLITLVSVLTNIAISLTLVPVLGIVGAAIGTTVQYSIYGLSLYILIKRKLGYRSSAFNRIGQ